MRRIVVFFESGRLGNQVLQYMALKKFDPDARIFLLGFSSLKELLDDDWIQCTSIFCRLLRRLIIRVGRDRLNTLACKYRLISTVEENFESDDSIFIEKKGLFSFIVLVKPSYFQFEKTISGFFEGGFSLPFRQPLLEEASAVLDQLPAKRENVYFLHIRRGDYINWPSKAWSAVLPYQWYKQQMNAIRDVNPDAYFLLTTDDPFYVTDFFEKEPNCTLHHKDEALDLLVMSFCQGGGILSASSFSLVAAFSNKINYKSEQYMHIAPLFWGGFRKNQWHPSKIKMSWLTYAAVHL